MIKQPKYLTAPPGDTVIWRYMDLPKLLSLFSERALWFTRLDKLTDEYEGTIPVENQTNMFNSFKRIVSNKAAVEILRRQIEKSRQYKEWTLINSWSIGEVESFALWKIYLSNSQYGVAVKSTVTRFIEAIQHEDTNITPIAVRYYNIASEALEPLKQEIISGSKSRFYQYENEFRAVILDQFVSGQDTREPKHENGTYVPVDLVLLIESIYTSPGAPNWFIKLVFDLVKKFEVPVFVTDSFIKDKL
jgi:hypothetical protein